MAAEDGLYIATDLDKKRLTEMFLKCMGMGEITLIPSPEDELSGAEQIGS